jgi:cardiolipin synthase (CMP-forming)
MGAARFRIELSHLPNLICVLRILLVVPIVLALLDGNQRLALALIVVAGISDGLDGFLAKRFGWRTRLGGILDPAADKILLVAVYVTLVWTGLVPFWLMAVVLGRDLLIVSGTLAYQWLIGPVQPAPSRISKLNTAVQLLLCLAVLAAEAFGWPPRAAVVLLGAGVLVTSVISGLDYVLRWSMLAIANGRRPPAAGQPS